MIKQKMMGHFIQTVLLRRAVTQLDQIVDEGRCISGPDLEPDQTIVMSAGGGLQGRFATTGAEQLGQKR